MTVRLDDQDIEKNGKYPRDNDDGQILSPWLRERERERERNERAGELRETKWEREGEKKDKERV
jgi:hypothetical protein